MNRPTASGPNPLSQTLRASEAAWRRQDFQLSIKLLERATKINPADPCVYLDLGRAQGLRYDYAAAERSFEKAIRASNGHVQSYIAAGLHCFNFGQHEKAEVYFKRGWQHHARSAPVMVELAGVLERRQNLEPAADLIGRALELDHDHPPALLVQARIERGRGRLEKAEAILRQLFQLRRAEIQTQVHAWYELGGILDRQKRFDEAMAAFLAAKKLLQPEAVKFIEQRPRLRAGLQLLQDQITAADLQRWQAAGARLQPARSIALMCGHPRSGTTLLEQVLDAHPGVISAEETSIFTTDAWQPLGRSFSEDAASLDILNAATEVALRQSRSNYFNYTEKFLGQPVGRRLLIDKNPAMNPFIPAFARVFPEAKLMVAIRDPRDVCLSCFMQPLAVNQVSCAYLNLADTGAQYASVMGFWKALQPRLSQPSLEIRYEELVADLESVARRTLDFLGLPWDEKVLQFSEHARSKIIRSPTYAEASKPIFKTAIGRWRNYQKYLEPALEHLEPFVKMFGYEPS